MASCSSCAKGFGTAQRGGTHLVDFHDEYCLGLLPWLSPGGNFSFSTGWHGEIFTMALYCMTGQETI